MMAGFDCATCGEHHDDLLMCLGSPAPALWFSIPEEEREKRSVLSSDQCIIDEKHYFILGQLELPVIDAPNPFVWLVWVSLSERNFLRAAELWTVPGRETEPSYFGWLQTALPYEPSTLSLKTQVHTRPVGERPFIELEATDHPLSIEQRQGISLARVQAIVERVLHG
jgi:hypothetical protein